MLALSKTSPLARELYRNNIPPNVRTYGETILGNRDEITEQNFTEKELATLKDILKKRKNKSSIGYGDYDSEIFHNNLNNGLLGTTIDSFKDPIGALMFTLGQALVEEDDEGFTVTDQYDFAATPEQVEELGLLGGIKTFLDGSNRTGNPNAMGNLLGNFAVPKGKGRKVKIRIKK